MSLFQIVAFFFIILASFLTPTESQDCAAGVDTCVNTVFAIITTHGNNRDIVCNATDDFLQCVARETRTCDAIIAATVKEGVSPMIEIYQAEPYNCQFVSADDDALKHDACSEEMSRCSVYYYQAETEPQYDIACSLFEDYLSCMKKNTTTCGVDLQSSITEHADNATATFDGYPFYCEERLKYNIDAVDANMNNCTEILNSLNRQVVRQDYVCGVYNDFYTCAVDALAPASPRQFAHYVEFVNGASESFRIYPYFCESQDPCLTLFKSCNTSAYAPHITPCKLMDVYTSCLTSALSYCAEGDYAVLANNVQDWRGEIHNKFNCIAENIDKTYEDLAEEDGEDQNGDSTQNQNGGNGGTEETNTPVVDKNNDNTQGNSVPVTEPEPEVNSDDNQQNDNTDDDSSFPNTNNNGNAQIDDTPNSDKNKGTDTSTAHGQGSENSQSADKNSNQADSTQEDTNQSENNGDTNQSPASEQNSDNSAGSFKACALLLTSLLVISAV